MWYPLSPKQERQVWAQLQDTPDVPEEAISAPSTPTPDEIPAAPEAVPPPAPVPQPPQAPVWTGPVPPIHDRCHCSIETLPGGNRVWKTNGEHACPLCMQLRDAFNRLSYSAVPDVANG